MLGYNDDMITVIIAGGSGTRLWPLSTTTKPKQLLNLAGSRTMVQQAYDRAVRLGSSIYVVTEASHSDSIREQLPELPDTAFLVEPGRRNTASCVIMALAYIQAGHDNDEPIAFLSSDHTIRDVEGFVTSFDRAGKLSVATGSEVLVGIEPSYASTGFGYIEKGNSVHAEIGAFNVASYKEKPDFETATSFISSGNYLWNAGYFVGSVNVFLNKMKQYAPNLYQQYEDLKNAPLESRDEVYLGFENVAIDIALNEKVKDLLVIPASFDWRDIGNFKDLHDAVTRDQSDNYQKGDNIYPVDVENSYIRNEEDKPIAVIGLDNIVVVNTPDGILVSRKDVSHQVGDIAKKIQ